jgi:uncharacterized coiled-coil protein SlyX
MKKLSFIEKNNFVIRHKSAKYFSLDLDLFRRTYLTHKLNTDLARANLHTYERLDGQMLYVLLDALPPDAILANRTPTPPVPPDKEKTPGPQAPNPDPQTQTPAASEEIRELKKRIDELEESNELNRDEIESLRSSLDDSETSIEDLRSAIEALEKKAFNKKKASGKSSPP